MFKSILLTICTFYEKDITDKNYMQNQNLIKENFILIKQILKINLKILYKTFKLTLNFPFTLYNIRSYLHLQS